MSKEKRKVGLGCHCMTNNNTLAWELISHLWFLLVLVVMTTLCVWIFKRIRNNLENSDKTNKKFSMVKLSVIFLCLGIGYAVIRRTIFIVYPPILSNGMFNFIVMQTLFLFAVLYPPAHWLSFSLILKPCLPRRLVAVPLQQHWRLSLIYSTSAMAVAMPGCTKPSR
ncbi:glucans biosynthesis acyltransferase [Escherichia coli]|uniref:Glucans biosynthesis acyltransferase n=1 Tax=Escherichia coli TaxID=562 RepID=A0A2X1IWN1_ECOLX|nr:glucans biosynthesis acyltransferase [Escherichia coli]